MADDFKPKPKEKELSDGNALWRIPTWMPSLSAAHETSLRSFHAELIKFNGKLNLISRNTEREADLEHFADCLLAADILLKQNLGTRVYDMGSGNGFPGLVLAILDSTREYALVESDTRKCEFLKHVVGLLKLKHVQVMTLRLESLAASQVEVAVSRGLASISKTVLACNRIFPKGGRFFHLKGKNWSSEIADLPSQLISVWRPHLSGEYTLPVTQVRRAVVMTEKIQ